MSDNSVADDLIRFAELAKKHPWYDPGATIAENLRRCRDYRGSKWENTPGSIGAALSSIIRDK